MEHFYRGIPGWFDWQDTYHRWAREVPPGGTIVEMGAYAGKSLAFLLVELHNLGRTDVRVVAVDDWSGVSGQYEGEALERLFHANLAPVQDRLIVYSMRSAQAAEMFLELTVDRVWLDGNHDYRSVAQDLNLWWPKIRIGGEMGGHDYAWSSVSRAVNEWCHLRGRSPIVLPASAGEGSMPSWLLQKR